MASNKGKDACVELNGDNSSEKTYGGSNTNAPDVFLSIQNDEIDLRVGMVAQSEEEAFDMYNKYGCSKGFSIRKSQKTFKRGTQEIIRRTFVCSKEGFREFTEPGEVKNVERLDTRCGCRARVVFKVENGVYKISQLVTEHNHPLVEPNQRHLMRSARKIYETSKAGIKSMADVGIRASKIYAYGVGGYQNVESVERDCQNIIQVERAKKIASDDCQRLLKYFMHKQVVGQMFLYMVQVDEENRITNFFWRDGLSKLDYECFGDVIIFDTTYRNKNNVICAPFFGVNHHGKNVVFGCAFLGDEGISSFVWLFETFLESMDGKTPKTIFTNQDDAMAEAIARVLPNAQHRWCPWHISKNGTLNISSLCHEPGFRSMFSYLLEKCEHESEFEEKWAQMIEKWGCSNQSWLLKLYDLREKWAPAYSRDTFSCNIRYSHKRGSIDHIFQHMDCKTMTLTEFVHHYEQNVEKMREVEVTDDYNCAHGKPRILSRSSGILQHACKVYTHKLFAMFQDEFVQSLCVVEVESNHNETYHLYKLRMEDDEQERVVHFNSSDLSVSCSCKQFESLGLLCCHALRVLNLNGVIKIPDQYILRRWTKAARHGLVLDENNTLPANTSGSSAKTGRLNKLMDKVFNLMNLSANSEATTEIADRFLDNTFQQVAKFYAASSEGAEVLDDSAIPLSNSDTPIQKGQTHGRKDGVSVKKKRKLGNTPKSTSLLPSNTNTGVGMQSSAVGPPNLYPYGMQMSGNCQSQFIPMFGMPAPNVHTSLPATNLGYSNCTPGTQDSTNVPHFSQECHEYD